MRRCEASKVPKVCQDQPDREARKVRLVPKETKAKEARRGLPVLPDPRALQVLRSQHLRIRRQRHLLAPKLA